MAEPSDILEYAGQGFIEVGIAAPCRGREQIRRQDVETFPSRFPCGQFSIGIA